MATPWSAVRNPRRSSSVYASWRAVLTPAMRRRIAASRQLLARGEQVAEGCGGVRSGANGSHLHVTGSAPGFAARPDVADREGVESVTHVEQHRLAEGLVGDPRISRPTSRP